VDRLQAVVITAMPDCLLYDSWADESSTANSEEAATYFGDLVRANQEALRVLDAWSEDMQVTIESGGLLIILQRVGEHFTVGFVFSDDAPLGMVRLQTRRMLSVLEDSLPTFEVEETPRGQKVLDFVERYAPDPHTVLLRVAVKARIPLDELKSPENLTGDTLERVEEAVRDILGLDSLNL
jgi:hypothetical protein